MRRGSCEENDITIKKFTGNKKINLCQCYHAHPIIYFVTSFKYIYVKKYITGIYRCDITKNQFSK